MLVHNSRKGVFAIDMLVKVLVGLAVLFIIIYLTYIFREKIIDAFEFLKGIVI